MKLPKRIISSWEYLSDIQKGIVEVWMHHRRGDGKGFIPPHTWKTLGISRGKFYRHLKRLKDMRILWYPRRCTGRYHYLRLYNGTALTPTPRHGCTWDD